MKGLACIAFFGLGLALAYGSGNHREPHHLPPKKSLVHRLSLVRRRRVETVQELRKTRHYAYLVKRDVLSLDHKIGSLSNTLSVTQNRLAAARTKRRRLEKSLNVSEGQLSHTRQMVKTRLKWIYMRGSASWLTVVVGSRSVGDLASRGEFMDDVAKKDQMLFARYRNLVARVSQQKQAEDETVAQVADLSNQERLKKRQLQVTRGEKGAVLFGLQAKQRRLQDAVRQLDEDEQQIASEIEAYSRGSVRKWVPMPGRLLRPVPGPVTSPFGMRWHPILHIMRMHDGVDFGAPYGTPIHAAAAGVVISAHYSRSYGNVIILGHAGGLCTLYAHCSRLYVRTGDHVRAGEVIGAVGATGLATGPHLHFEVWVHGHKVNPLRYVP